MPSKCAAMISQLESGYDFQRQQLSNKVQAVLNRKPVACWTPGRSDTTFSIDPISGRAWTSELITNLCTNGGFTTNTTGWTTGGTNTIASAVSTVPMFGTKSCLFTYSNNTVYASFAVTLTAAVYTCYCWVYLPSNFDGQAITLTDNGSFVGATVVPGSVNMALTNQWQRVQCTITPVGGDLVGTLVLLGSGTAPTVGRTLQMDGVQIQLGGLATEYIETDGGTAQARALMSQTIGSLGRGNSRSFNGLYQLLTTPNTTDLNFGNGTTDQPFSLVALISLTAVSGTTMFVCKYVNTTYEYSFGQVSAKLHFQCIDASVPVSTNRQSNASISAPTGWVHYAGTYSAATGGATAANDMLLYQNGVAIASTATNQATYVAMESLSSVGSVGAFGDGQGTFVQGTLAMCLIVPGAISAPSELALNGILRDFFQVAI